ncbi:MAG: 5-(carboxyamino)imidazole ribonucleotide mutase, partial [Succinivibrio sp.]
TVAVGKAGAKNAAYLAAQIIALTDSEIDAKVKADRAKASEDVMKKDAALQEKLKSL